jgi:hypothetical protein
VCRFRCRRLVGRSRIGWWRGLVLAVELGRMVLRGEVVRGLASKGVVGVKSSWVGRSLEVGWVQELLMVEGLRRG